MKEQIKKAWCKHCRNAVKFRKHEDYKDRWVCTSGGCWNWERKEDLKENPSEKKIWI